MRYYVQHRHGTILSVGPERRHEEDVEISEALASLFYDTEEDIQNWEVVRGRLVKNILGMRLGDGELVKLNYTNQTQVGTGLVISPNFEEGVVEFFLDQEIIHNIHTKQFSFFVNKTEYVIDLTEFEEGQFTLHAHIHKRFDFKVQRIVENLYLVPGYGQWVYRQRNRTILARRVGEGRYMLPHEELEGLTLTFSAVEDPNVILATQPAQQPFVFQSSAHTYFKGLRVRAN